MTRYAGCHGGERAMMDAAQKRAALIEQLENARGIASELGDGATEYLIERALARTKLRGWKQRNASSVGCRTSVDGFSKAISGGNGVLTLSGP
jgi:hypothetical protein